MKAAIAAPGREVSKVIRGRAPDALSARIAGPVIRTSPSVSRRTQRTFAAAVQFTTVHYPRARIEKRF
jgi:hypothetical protein